MKFLIKKTTFITISVLLTIIVLLQQYAVNESQFCKGLPQFTTQTQDYSLNSTASILLNSSPEIDQPKEELGPQDNNYYLQILQELFEVGTGFHDNLFIAQKRVAELKEFGGSLKMVNNFNVSGPSYIKQLKQKFQREHEVKWYINQVQNASYWEMSLLRYVSAVEDHVNTIRHENQAQFIFDLARTKETVEINEDSLDRVIENRNGVEKDYLRNLVYSSFDYLNSVILLPYLKKYAYTPKGISYLLPQTVDNPTSFYDLQFESSQTAIPENFRLNLKYPSLTTRIASLNHVQIHDGAEKIQLTLTPTLLSSIDESYNYKNPYSAEIELSPQNSNQFPSQFIFQAKYQITVPLTVEIDFPRYEKGELTKFSTYIFSKKIFPSSATFLHQEVINMPGDFIYMKPRILVSAEKSLNQNELKNLHIDLIPYSSPTIIVHKLLGKNTPQPHITKVDTVFGISDLTTENYVGSLIKICQKSTNLGWMFINSNFINNQVHMKFVFWPIYAVMIILFIYSVFVYFKKPRHQLYIKFILGIKKLYALVTTQVRKLEHSLVLLRQIFALVFLYLFQVVLNSSISSSDFFYILLALSWVFVVISFETPPALSLAISFFLMTYSVRADAQYQALLPEKYAVLSVIFIGLSAFNLIIYRKKENVIVGIKRVFATLFFLNTVYGSKIEPAMHALYSNLQLQIVNHLTHIGLLFRVYFKKQQAKGFLPFFMFLLFYGTLFISILTLTGYFSIKTILYYQTIHMQAKFLKHELYIKEIVPSHSILGEVVTLKGYNFAWKTSNDYNINSTYGTIPTHKWSDEIIEFNIPLHLKEGLNEIWVEKPVDDSHPKKIIKSNTVELYLLSRQQFYTTKSDSLNTKIIKKLKLFLLRKFPAIFELSIKKSP